MTETQQADPYGRGSYCIVVALHGTDSREAEALRAFRDKYLTRVPGGDAFMDFYYHISPGVTAFLDGRDRIASICATGIGAIARTVPPW